MDRDEERVELVHVAACFVRVGHVVRQIGAPVGVDVAIRLVLYAECARIGSHEQGHEHTWLEKKTEAVPCGEGRVKTRL